MKKFLDLVLFGAATLFSLLIFVFMALPAFVLKSGSISVSSDSLYECMEKGVVVVAFIFMILVFLVAACLCTLALLKQLGTCKFELPYPHFIALGAALLALVACVLYFVVPAVLWDGSNIGAGSLLCALMALFAALSLGCFGALKLMKK